MRQFSIILTIFLTICFAQNTFAQKTFKLGFVKKYDFSGDSIWLANAKKKDRVDSKSIAIFSYNGLGTININGRDIDLKQTGGYLADKNFKVGRGGYETLKGRNIKIRLDYVYTWLCPRNQENCSVYYYKGVLDINYNGKRRKVDVVGFGGS
jgi:hypothetical protein